jgi:hypothetical protein
LYLRTWNIGTGFRAGYRTKWSVLKLAQEGGQIMTETDQPDPERMEVLRSLPAEITKTLTKEEIKAFLFDDKWPGSLKEKLKDYLV